MSKKLKICYIGDGHSIHNHFMVDWFVQRGHEVIFLTDSSVDLPPCQVYSVAPQKGHGLFRHWAAIKNTRNLINIFQPDIVHAHNVTGYGYWGAMAGFSPFILTSWGSDLLLQARESIFVRMLVTYCLRKADLITGDAEDLCRVAEKMTGKNADVRLLQWGVNLAPYNAERDPTLHEQIRQGRDVVFVSTRRLRPLYNIDIILKAFARIVSSLPSSLLLIVGDDHQKAELLGLRDELGLGNHVMFTGWLTPDEMVVVLRHSDAFVSVPSSDSTALSLLEAFAASLPVIVSDLPANHEWITHQQNGLLVCPKDIESLAQAMLEVAQHPERSKQWGLMNRRIVEERGNRQIEMEKLEEWYYEFRN